MTESWRRTTEETLVSILRWRAANQPDRLAYVFASEGAEDIRLTYADLDRRARSIAVSLQRAASRGDCALLLHPPGLEFLAAFFGCLYAGVVAVPLFPVRSNREDARLDAIAQDSGARLALTVTRALPERVSSGARYGGLDFLLTDKVDDTQADRWSESPIDQGQLAYLQYTSGSTSAPKGVMVSHRNIISNCAFLEASCELSEQSVSVTWLPHFHDMGLVDGLLNPLHVGYPAVVMPPAQFVAKPLRWLQLITRFRATHSGAPNFAYDLCVQKIHPEQRAELDLASWTMAYSGSEPVRVETLNRFAEFFAPCGFQRRALSPSYGLAEGTLMVSSTGRSSGPIVKDVDAVQLERGVIAAANGAKRRQLVGCGRVPRGIDVAIVDPGTLRASREGAVGEIWVSGPSVAGGYWRQPEQSAQTFQAFLADTHAGPFLRTGDLGFVADEHLFVTGRLKDLIIVSGANYYPQDIEAIVDSAHPALRPGQCVAFSVDVDGRESLVIGHELDRRFKSTDPAELEEIAAAIRRAVQLEFGLEVYVVQLLRVGSIMRTSSGKLQRQACRADFLSGQSDVVFESRITRALPDSLQGAAGFSRSELLAVSPAERGFVLEERLRRHVAEVLEIPWQQIDVSEPLGSYGGLESMKGILLVTSIEECLDVTLSPTALFTHPSVAELARHLAGLMGFAPDSGEISQKPVVMPAVRAREDEGLAELLGAVDRTSISDMQQLASERKTGTGASYE